MDKTDKQMILDVLEIVARLNKKVSALDSCQDDLTQAVTALLPGHDEAKARWKSDLAKVGFERDQLDTAIRNLMDRLKARLAPPPAAAPLIAALLTAPAWAT
jgi:hypothetical protein